MTEIAVFFFKEKTRLNIFWGLIMNYCLSLHSGLHWMLAEIAEISCYIIPCLVEDFIKSVVVVMQNCQE